MKRIAAVAVLALCLAAPLSAAPGDDDGPGRSSPIQRVVRLVRHLVAIVLDGGDMSLPKP